MTPSVCIKGRKAHFAIFLLFVFETKGDVPQPSSAFDTGHKSRLWTGDSRVLTRAHREKAFVSQHHTRRIDLGSILALLQGVYLVWVVCDEDGHRRNSARDVARYRNEALCAQTPACLVSLTPELVAFPLFYKMVLTFWVGIVLGTPAITSTAWVYSAPLRLLTQPLQGMHLQYLPTYLSSAWLYCSDRRISRTPASPILAFSSGPYQTPTQTPIPNLASAGFPSHSLFDTG